MFFKSINSSITSFEACPQDKTVYYSTNPNSAQADDYYLHQNKNH